MAGKDEALRIVRNELDALRLRIIEHHINAGQRASGKTIASLHIEMLEDKGILWGRQAFKVLESGRKGGKVPKGFYKIIQQWVKDKGIQVENPKSFSYLVARKIANEGTNLFRDGGRTDIYSSDLEKTIENIKNKVFGIFEKDVEHINLHNNEDA